mgnify:CR=1 FL=1
MSFWYFIEILHTLAKSNLIGEVSMTQESIGLGSNMDRIYIMQECLL